jgi:CubicO group peptidase (beta-lactamase class C family)
MKILYLICVLCFLTGSSYSQYGSFQDSIDTYSKKHHFSGTLLVQKNNRVLIHSSYGLANRPFRIQNTIETKYKIASVTKLFTSVLIMQLVEQGKIGLNNPIGNYLPEYRGQGSDKITITHLLNHTSGLPYAGPSSKEDALQHGMDMYQMPHSVDELISGFYSGNPESEPGKKFSYNNGEYIILGKIIEMIYGKSLEQILHEQILEPSGMKQSGLLFQYRIIDNLSDTYFTMNDSSGLVNDMPVYIQNWYSAGAMYSTTSDLDKFSDALFSGKLLNNESLYLMLKPGLDGYGFGMWIYDFDTNGKKFRVIKRPGDIMGSRAMFVYLPEQSLSVIILANTDEADLDDFNDHVLNLTVLHE